MSEEHPQRNRTNIALWLTFARIFAIPVVAILYFLPFRWAHPVTAIIFLLIAITDWLDGYLARYFKQTTKLGAFLDPVADKLLVSLVLIMIVGMRELPYLVLPAAIIVGREIVVSALREWMAELGKRASVAVSYLGKVKTVVQMAALVILLWYNTESWVIVKVLGELLLYIAAILTLWSMVIYLRLAWPDLKANGVVRGD